MTLDDLRANPVFMDGFSNAWPMLQRFLIARTLCSARAAKCVIESAQAETARTKELAQLISELATLATPASAPKPAPRMPQLNSMSETET